jgi:hypothetical protein
MNEVNTMNSIPSESADTIEREQRRRRMRRVQVGMAVFVLCLGLVNLFGVAGKPRFETYHTLDVIRLVLAGAGFGVALVLLIQFFKFGMWKEQRDHLPGPPSEANKE